MELLRSSSSFHGTTRDYYYRHIVHRRRTSYVVHSAHYGQTTDSVGLSSFVVVVVGKLPFLLSTPHPPALKPHSRAFLCFQLLLFGTTKINTPLSGAASIAFESL